MEFTRASQVAPGMLFNSSMMTSWSWQIFETLHTFTFRFKDVLLSSSQETCLASPSPLPSASSVKQWSSWRCVWGHCHAGILPCYPVSEGRGSCSAAVFHSTCWSSCFPQWNITLQHLQHSCNLRPWHSTTMLDCKHDTLIFVLLSWSLPHMLKAIRTKQINLHLIRP